MVEVNISTIMLERERERHGGEKNCVCTVCPSRRTRHRCTAAVYRRTGTLIGPHYTSTQFYKFHLREGVQTFLIFNFSFDYFYFVVLISSGS